MEVSRLDNVIEYNPADLTVTTQAGITVGSLRRVLEKKAQFLAIDPPLPDRATIGGTLASGADGPLRWHYGHPRDSVIGMRVVQADGTITKSGGQVVKNVSGYDMSRLHIGGLGTLGVIAEVSFKLTPLPQRQTTLLGGFESVEAALEAGLGIFHSQVMPLALTVFDDTVRRPPGFEAPGSSHLLAVRLGGRARSLRRQVAECAAVCSAHGVGSIREIEGDDAASLWRSPGRLRLGPGDRPDGGQGIPHAPLDPTHDGRTAGDEGRRSTALLSGGARIRCGPHDLVR